MPGWACESLQLAGRDRSEPIVFAGIDLAKNVFALLCVVEHARHAAPPGLPIVRRLISELMRD